MNVFLIYGSTLARLISSDKNWYIKICYTLSS